MDTAGVATDKKKARRSRAVIVVADEFGLGYRTRPATTWGQRGQTPELQRQDGARGLHCFAALSSGLKIYTKYFQHPIRGRDVVEGLRHLRRYISERIILVWDRYSAHRSGVVDDYLSGDGGIDIVEFPVGSPEVNPEEYCHGYAKGRLRNYAPESLKEVKEIFQREIRRMRRRPGLLASFFDHAKIPILNSFT